MPASTWTAADQTALNELERKRNEYHNSIRQPIKDHISRYLPSMIDPEELFLYFTDHADEITEMLKPFLIPKVPLGQTLNFVAALTEQEIGIAQYNGDSRDPMITINDGGRNVAKLDTYPLFIKLKG